jgi:hypothetical protein
MSLILDLNDYIDIGINKKLILPVIPSSIMFLFDILLFFDIFTNGWATKTLFNFSLFFSIPLLVAIFIFCLIANLQISGIILMFIYGNIFKAKGQVTELDYHKVNAMFWANLIFPSFLLSFLFPIWLSLFALNYSKIITYFLILFFVLCFAFTCFSVKMSLKMPETK